MDQQTYKDFIKSLNEQGVVNTELRPETLIPELDALESHAQALNDRSQKLRLAFQDHWHCDGNKFHEIKQAYYQSLYQSLTDEL